MVPAGMVPGMVPYSMVVVPYHTAGMLPAVRTAGTSTSSTDWSVLEYWVRQPPGDMTELGSTVLQH
jgi:hypothetical protein